MTIPRSKALPADLPNSFLPSIFGTVSFNGRLSSEAITVATCSYNTASRCPCRHYGKRFSSPARPNYPSRQSLPICAHRAICLKANGNVWRVKSRRRKSRVDSKRGAFNNPNRLHPTPDTTVLPCHQDNPLLHSRRRRAFHIILFPLRRRPHPLRPLLPSRHLPLAHDSIARLVAMAAHLPHPLVAKMVLCMLCVRVRGASMMTKIALSQYNAPNSLIVQDSFVHSLPLFCLELPLCLFYPPFLPSHRTRDDTAAFTHSSVLVYNHHRCPWPGERSTQDPIDAIDSFSFSFACPRHLKLSLRPVAIPFACSRPFRCAATPCLLLSLAPFAFPSGLRTCLGFHELPFEHT